MPTRRSDGSAAGCGVACGKTLAAAERPRPDVALLDLGMPKCGLRRCHAWVDAPPL
jgi:DNA-binding NarL/FixJ family response regulator